MNIHNIAALFPAMQADEYANLKADIQKHGLLTPIWTYQGQIVDGRNRYRACQELGIQPRYQEWDGNGSLVAFVVSLNLQRRHLTSSQRAVIALEVEGLLEKETKARVGGRPRKGDEFTEPMFEEKPAEIFPQVSDRDKRTAAGQAAAMMGTNAHYVRDAKRLERETPVVLEQVRNGTLTISAAKEVARLLKDEQIEAIAAAQNGSVHFSSESNEWYTPASLLSRIEKVLGQIDLDPCSNSREAPNVPALTHYTQEDDGLTKEWRGRVYMNPPYGRELSDWVAKLVKEWNKAHITEAIALVPSRTDTEWFRALESFDRCFLWGRLRFSGYDNSAPFPSMLVYIGNHHAKFAAAFSDIGTTYRRVV